MIFKLHKICKKLIRKIINGLEKITLLHLIGLQFVNSINCTMDNLISWDTLVFPSVLILVLRFNHKK